MPLPAAVLAAIIGGGASIAGQGASAVAQGSMNRKTRAFSREMYDRQRRDSLLDWTMQNEYNSPAAQIQRLKEAGLNPNLVYKNGADNTAGAVRSSSPPAWNPKAPTFDLGGAAATGLGAYYDTQVKQAQIDNIKANNSVLVQEALLKSAQILSTLATTGKTGVDTETSRFDLEMKQTLKDTSIDAAKAGLRKTEAETDVLLSRNEREAIAQDQSLRESVARIIQMRVNNRLTAEQTATESYKRSNIEMDTIYKSEALKMLDKDQQLKQLDINLKQLGMQPTDALWQRAVGQILEKITASKEFDKLEEELKRLQRERDAKKKQ